MRQIAWCICGRDELIDNRQGRYQKLTPLIRKPPQGGYGDGSARGKNHCSCHSSKGEWPFIEKSGDLTVGGQGEGPINKGLHVE